MIDKPQVHKLEVLPIKNQTNKKEFDILEPLLQPPFTYVLVAPTKSGKSVLIVNLLRNVNFYHTVFDEIIYISPTVMFDKTLKTAVADNDEIVKIHEEKELENIDHILHEIFKKQGDTPEEDRKHILIVLDDMLEYFNNHSKLNTLPAISRHFKVSFIVTTQVYVGLPVRLRKNASAYMVFHLFNNKDLHALNDEVGVNFGENFLENYKKATEEKYNFLYINNREMELYHNFKTLMWKS